MKIDRNYVHQKYNGHCAYCGRVITLKEMQVDHFVPKYKSMSMGTVVYHPDNLMPSCRSCNHYKRASPIEYFRELLMTIHTRIAKIYIVKVAINFGIIQFKSFDGEFYYEKVDKG